MCHCMGVKRCSVGAWPEMELAGHGKEKNGALACKEKENKSLKVSSEIVWGFTEMGISLDRSKTLKCLCRNSHKHKFR